MSVTIQIPIYEKYLGYAFLSTSIYSFHRNNSALSPSITILCWSCWHGPPFVILSRWIQDILYGGIRLYSWLPLSCVFPCLVPQVARFTGPAWGPSGADTTQVGPMLAPWTLQSGASCLVVQPFGKQFLYHSLSVRSASLWWGTFRAGKGGTLRQSGAHFTIMD